MKKLAALAAITFVMTPVSAHAFLKDLVVNTVKEEVKSAIKDETKEVVKETTKAALKEQGIEGADRVVDVAVNNSDNIQNLGAGASVMGGAIGAGGITGASAAASTAAMAYEAHKSLEADAPQAQEIEEAEAASSIIPSSGLTFTAPTSGGND